MVLATALIIGAAAYVSSQKECEPAFDAEGKEVVEMLPHEQLAFLEPPISTLTFFEGKADAAADYLQRRVADVMKANPWLAGWLHTTKGVMKMYYDPDAKDVAQGIFRRFEPGDVPLSTDTPYEERAKILSDCGAKVKVNTDLIGLNEPIFKVSVIPDAVAPDERFALVVSMSHVGGDAHSFYQIYKMLGKDRPILSLNPKRMESFQEKAKAKMGDRESRWMGDNAGNSVWKKLMNDKSEKMLFIISDDWLQEQRRIWAVSKGIRSKINSWIVQSKAKGQKQEINWLSRIFCWGGISSFFQAQPDSDDVSIEEQELMTTKKFDEEEDSRLSNNDILISWFWKTVDANVGLMAYNFRNRIAGLTDVDAGNYQNPIPYTPGDYKSPHLIMQSRKSARRAGASHILNPTLLPEGGAATKVSIATNWSTFHREDLALEGATEQTLHMPLYSARDFEFIPNNVTLFMTFHAGGNRLGGFVIAPKAVVDTIKSCGLAQEILASVET